MQKLQCNCNRKKANFTKQIANDSACKTADRANWDLLRPGIVVPGAAAPGCLKNPIFGYLGQAGHSLVALCRFVCCKICPILSQSPLLCDDCSSAAERY